MTIAALVLGLAFYSCDEITTHARVDQNLDYKVTTWANWKF